MYKRTLVPVSILLCSFVLGQPQHADFGRLRTYYIAADETDWDYAPSGKDLIHDEKYHFRDDPASKGIVNPKVSIYRKVVFHEYADADFHALKPRSDDWVHLGILGPLIRAEVGDTIKVVFRNNASHPFSLHPHGVLYLKESEGAAYQDNTSGKEKADDSVAPGASYIYTWSVPERAGPAESEGSTAFWVYHSHVDESKDINSGLIGPIIITRRGFAHDDASPKDVDREFVIQFGFYDEHLSWYWDANKPKIMPEVTFTSTTFTTFIRSTAISTGTAR